MTSRTNQCALSANERSTSRKRYHEISGVFENSNQAVIYFCFANNAIHNKLILAGIAEKTIRTRGQRMGRQSMEPTIKPIMLKVVFPTVILFLTVHTDPKGQ